MSTSTRLFRASCHCGSSHLSFAVLSDSLPLPVHFCHCGICRRTHGTLLSTHAPIPPPDVDLNTFTSYKTSKIVTIWFCKSCGAHMLDSVDGHGKQKWFITVSMVDVKLEDEVDVWRYTGHIFVGSTGDGGLAPYLANIGGLQMSMWDERPVDDPRFEGKGDWCLKELKHDDVERDGNGRSRASCNCGQVTFEIAQPRSHKTEDSSASTWRGQHCACNSCRLTSSSFVTSWVIVPLSSITINDDIASLGDEISGLGTVYQSSDGVSRTFCSTCGASVSYRRDDDPHTMKVAAGLLQGANTRAETVIAWDENLLGTQDAKLRSVLGSLTEQRRS